MGVGPRASAGERHAVLRDATAQAAEPPDNQMQSKHCVPGRIAHEVGPPRPSASRRGRASGRAGDAGTTPWRAPRRRPERDSIRPSQPTGQSGDKQRESRELEFSRHPRARARRRASAESGSASVMPYGLPHTSIFPLTNHSFIAPRPRPTSPSPRCHHHTSTPVTPPLPRPLARPDGRAQGSTSCSNTRGAAPALPGAGSTPGQRGRRS